MMKHCLLALLALLVGLTATPLLAQVQITGTVGEIVDTSPDAGPDFPGQEGYFLRYVGNPAPTGYSHDYQWADPYIQTVSPEITPVVFTGTLDLSTRIQTDGHASFIGLHDLTSHALGYGGGSDATATWTDGAYIYVRNYANGDVDIGPSDGNAGGGEYVQKWHKILAADIPLDGIIDVTFVIDGTADPETCGDLPEATGDAGCMTLTVGALAPLTDSYGDKLAPDSANPEFSNGGHPGWDASHSGGGGVGYDLIVSPLFFGNANLTLVKEAAPSEVVVGEMVTYTITVENNGPDAATEVIVTDVLPGGMVYVSSNTSSGPGCSEAAGTVTCELGDIAANASATATIVVEVTQIGDFVNTASAAANEDDADGAIGAAPVVTVSSAINNIPAASQIGLIALALLLALGAVFVLRRRSRFAGT